MVAWWVMMLIQIGLSLVYDLVKPKPNFDSPDPAGLSDFRVPTTGEGRPIPVAWGTVLCSGPMLAWYGDLKVTPIEEEISTGWFTSETVTKGYDYYLGMNLVLCSGEIDAALRPWFDGEPLPYRNALPHFYEEGYTRYSRSEYDGFDVQAFEYFGGVDGEGGLWGDILVYRGSTTQPIDNYLAQKISSNLPAYRGICYAVFRLHETQTLTGFYWGTSPYIKDVAIELRRCPNSLSLPLDYHRIGQDANPACMIYDLLTTAPSLNGLGIPVGNIDVDSFRAAGTTLAEEELGLSMLVDAEVSAKDLLLDILRHIDGVVYVEPSTGLLVLDLVRFDYDEEELPVLDETNCTVTAYARSAWTDLKNQVRVQYINRRDGYVSKTVIAQNQAAIEAAGGEISTQDLNLRGFSHEATAARAASKALAGLSYPLATLSINADRSAWSFRPGSPFKLDWPKLGISSMVCRVQQIGKGELVSGRIELEAIEDYFAIDWTAYTPPDDSEWVDPAGPVPMLADQAVALGPYEAVKNLAVPDGGAQQVLTLASRASVGISKGYNAIVEDESTRFPFFTPSAELSAAINETSATIYATLGTDAAERLVSRNSAEFDAGLNLALIFEGTDPTQSDLEEIIAFENVTINELAGTITLTGLARGCCDTAPTSFASGKRIWFVSYSSGVVHIPGSGSTGIKFQPYNNMGGYDIDSCPTETISALSTARRELAYCPTDVRFNGDSYPATITGELTVSWAHRNRLGVWGYATSGETDAPEDGTTYTIRVYGELGTLIHTETGLTGETWTYLEADEITEGGLGRLNNSLRVEIDTICSGHYALRKIVWELSR